jgi:trans-4-hydroxy-L-proline dehydratase
VASVTKRVERLRALSVGAAPALTGERAEIVTEFYRANEGKHSAPVMRGLCFLEICRRKALYLGDEELIVGERGPAPKVVPTFPELTCHSLEDLRILSTRPMTRYAVPAEMMKAYEEQVIPYWRGRSMRDRIFAALPEEWKAAYEAGVYTEFMEQRAPGHTVLDGKIYGKGLVDFKADIARAVEKLDWRQDAEAWAKREELRGMDLACDAVLVWAARYAAEAERKAAAEGDAGRKAELRKIAEVCRRVPAQAPRDFQEALQHYWFCHLAVITELNGWDSFSPGHLDQHLLPFYRRGLESGELTVEGAKELLGAFFVKFNNHPAPSKVGVTAAESGTYQDFANINIGGLLADGSDGSNEVSRLLLDVIDELHLIQPSNNVQLSRKSPDALLRHALRVIRKGYGFPSLFNADAVVEEQLRMGTDLRDARAGGCSGCVETGAFGKEAYILTGYFNLPKMLELALHDGADGRTGRQLGPKTGKAETLTSVEEVFEAYAKQLRHFLEVKLAGNHLIEEMYARLMPAPFLSVLTDDCVARGRDYNAGGARYNNSYVQFVGIGTLTDSLAALEEVVFEKREMGLQALVEAMDGNFARDATLGQRLVWRTHKYGNDDDYADRHMRRAFALLVESLDGRPNGRGGRYRVEMLPTTCHIYFGQMTAATADGRQAGMPLSEGISPVQGADRHGPTAIIKSASKMDHIQTGGTLLNMKFTPAMLATEEGLDAVAHLVRTYFKMDGHHIQFNVVKAETLREAQANPGAHRDLIVRVAGYSDYFCDLSRELQEEIITRTEHGGT